MDYRKHFLSPQPSRNTLELRRQWEYLYERNMEFSDYYTEFDGETHGFGQSSHPRNPRYDFPSSYYFLTPERHTKTRPVSSSSRLSSFHSLSAKIQNLSIESYRRSRLAVLNPSSVLRRSNDVLRVQTRLWFLVAKFMSQRQLLEEVVLPINQRLLGNKFHQQVMHCLIEMLPSFIPPHPRLVQEFLLNKIMLQIMAETEFQQILIGISMHIRMSRQINMR